jgi:ferredoxin-NADP reductase
MWRVATISAIREETVSARTLVLAVPDWPGHLAGQHVDVRLTAEDGYQAQRSYSLASASSTVELTVQRVPRGELSPWLCDIAMPGDQFEIRGPVGGYFVWDSASSEPVLLVAGGSGVVPLMAMVRARTETGSTVPFRLVYSVRDPDTLFYGEELSRLAGNGFDLTLVYTREAPPGFPRAPGRLSGDDLSPAGWAASLGPSIFVCGPTGFVEATADLLVAAGHEAARIRTERFGPTS